MSSATARVADVAMVLMAAAVIGRFGLQLSESGRPPQVSDKPRAPAAATWKPGESVKPIEGVRFDDADRTLLLFVKSTCGFCTKSMPFYARIVALAESDRRLRIVPISVEPAATTESYFKQHDVTVTGARAVTPEVVSELRLSGTPTMILVDRQGAVMQFWRGMVRPENEASVLGILRGAAPVATTEGR